MAEQSKALTKPPAKKKDPKDYLIHDNLKGKTWADLHRKRLAKRGIDYDALNPIERLELGSIKEQKQARFCRAYIASGFDRSVAAKKAGYSLAYVISPAGIWGKPPVLEAIEFLTRQYAKKFDVNSEKVLHELALIGFSDISELFDENGTLKQITELPPHLAKAVQSIEVETVIDKFGISTTTAKIKMWDKLNALNTLAKHLNLFEAENKSKNDALEKLFSLRFIEPAQAPGDGNPDSG